MSTRPPARRRVSKQRYLVRRVGALAVVGLVVFGLVRLAGALGGGDQTAGATETSADDASGAGSEEPAGSDDPADPAPERPTTDAGAADAVTGDAVTGDGADTDSNDSSDPPEPIDPVDAAASTDREGPPTAADPARILIMGDSDAGTFGPYLQQLLGQTGVVRTELDYKVSSGLARPDFYDWHDALEQKVPPFDPDIVVITFGGNDAQFLADRSGASVVGQPRPDSDNAAWTEEYRDRVRRVVEYLESQGTIVVWVGIPNHVNPDVTFRMELQDRAVKAELAEHPEVRFVDTWTRFAGRNGGFAEFVIDPRDGQGKAVRASDGFHLNQTGAEILAIDIYGVLADELRALGASL